MISQLLTDFLDIEWRGNFSYNPAFFPRLEELSLHIDFSYGQIPGIEHEELRVSDFQRTLTKLSLNGFTLGDEFYNYTHPWPNPLQEISLRNVIIKRRDTLEALMDRDHHTLQKLHIYQLGLGEQRVSFPGFTYAKEGDPGLFDDMYVGDSDSSEISLWKHEWIWVDMNRYEVEIDSQVDDLHKKLTMLRSCFQVEEQRTQGFFERGYWWDPSE